MLKIIAILAGLTAIGFLAGSVALSGEIYGKPISDRTLTPICDIFDDPEKFDGKTITMQGSVDEEDNRGTWFYMQDDDCRVLVELWHTNIRVSKLMGSTVVVEGKVYLEKTVKLPGFIPTGVETQ